MQLLKCLVLADGIGEMKPSKGKSVGFATKKSAVVTVPPPHSTEYSISKPDQRLSEHHPELDRTVELVANVCLQCLSDVERLQVR